MGYHLKIIGVLLIVLSLMHVVFPKRFNWKKELSQLSLVNRQMFQVHVFFIALFVLMVGLMNVFLTEDLIYTQLGKWICLGLGVFWGIRSFIQWFGYSSQVWKGKFFETTMHILFSFFWVYMTVVYFKIGLV